MEQIILQLSNEFNIKSTQVENTIKLIDEGATIPFIARYRKEVTGSLDDTILRDLFDRLTYLRNLAKRKQEVLGSIEEQGKLTQELTNQIEQALTLSEVEDCYRPFKQKRKTRASVAKEKGLEPLALCILEQKSDGVSPQQLAADFIDEEKGVPDAQVALQGASDIIAEYIADHAEIRKVLRELFLKTALISSTKSKDDNHVYQMYFDFSEPIAKIAGYRILAIDRGEKEGFLKVTLLVDTQRATDCIFSKIITNTTDCSEFVKTATMDSYNRLLFPSLETEIRNFLTDNAATQAIKVFSLNLKPLLMQPPVKNKVALGLDPGYRTGCKIAVVDATGKVLDTTVIYATPPQSKIAESKKIIQALIEKHKVEIIAIGNGTASKESEFFIADLLKETGLSAAYMVVSEAGASVYSASKLAALEFPEYDVSLRSAISIARRLQDPLAELVKIDPKSIGVGQYQHDMPKAKLETALSGVVEDSVNAVGVNLNTASHSLLSYVAGINATVAKNIVSYREENGAFTSRKALLKVPKLGKKAYEQCAGFLRIDEGKHILDNTAVHPESYDAAEKLIQLCGYTLKDITNSNMQELFNRAQAYGFDSLCTQLEVGKPTLLDMIKELQKPGRDPRDELPLPLLRTDILDVKSLKPEMILDGTVRNVIDFGAFIDIGVHQDGMVHISQITDKKFIKHPSEVLTVGDVVKVKVLEIDEKRNRIALTMKGI